MQIVWFVLIGIVAGFLAGQLMEGHGFGVLGNLLVGVIGAVVGGFVFSLLGLSSSGLIGSLVVATVGAVILLGLVGMISRR